MPQLDILSFFTQIFRVFVSFAVLYQINVRFIPPNIEYINTVRNYLMSGTTTTDTDATYSLPEINSPLLPNKPAVIAGDQETTNNSKLAYYNALADAMIESKL